MSVSKEELLEVKEQVKLAVDYVLGGYENMVSDGHLPHSNVPEGSELVHEIYANMQYFHYVEGGEVETPYLSVQKCEPYLLKGLIALTLMEDD